MSTLLLEPVTLLMILLHLTPWQSVLATWAFDIALDSAKTLAGAGMAGSGLLGSVYMGGVDVRVNGWVDIAAH